MSEHKYITIEGAREHNLKNVSLKIPRDKMIVFTGLSGSGKSSLAFDTIYAEGQRRYMESLSSYARMFLGQADKPDVDKISGLSPAISIDQKSTNRNPRSTVGTVTEIYDYLRLLYARIGIPHCPKCGKVIERQTVDQMVDRIMELPEKTRFQIMSPVVRGRKGEHEKILERAAKSGFSRAIIDGIQYSLDEEIKLKKNNKHNIDIIVDRLAMKEGIEKRLADSIETALKLSDGLLKVDVIDGEMMNFSDSFSCPDCGISIDEIEPRSFSFNNPFGACPVCTGLGFRQEMDVDLMVPDKKRSINDGAFAVPGWVSSGDDKSFSHAVFEALSREYGFSLDTPWRELSDDAKNVILYGTKGHKVMVYYNSQRGSGRYSLAFEGVIRNVTQRYNETGSEAAKAEYESFMTYTPCAECNGMRLKKESLAITVCDKNIYDITQMPIGELYKFISGLDITERQRMIGD